MGDRIAASCAFAALLPGRKRERMQGRFIKTRRTGKYNAWRWLRTPCRAHCPKLCSIQILDDEIPRIIGIDTLEPVAVVKFPLLNAIALPVE
jgi:hypothetical protein